eukprot:Pgem_evm1s2380
MDMSLTDANDLKARGVSHLESGNSRIDSIKEQAGFPGLTMEFYDAIVDKVTADKHERVRRNWFVNTFKKVFNYVTGGDDEHKDKPAASPDKTPQSTTKKILKQIIVLRNNGQPISVVDNGMVGMSGFLNHTLYSKNYKSENLALALAAMNLNVKKPGNDTTTTKPKRVRRGKADILIDFADEATEIAAKALERSSKSADDVLEGLARGVADGSVSTEKLLADTVDEFFDCDPISLADEYVFKEVEYESKFLERVEEYKNKVTKDLEDLEDNLEYFDAFDGVTIADIAHAKGLQRKLLFQEQRAFVEARSALEKHLNTDDVFSMMRKSDTDARKVLAAYKELSKTDKKALDMEAMKTLHEFNRNAYDAVPKKGSYFEKAIETDRKLASHPFNPDTSNAAEKVMKAQAEFKVLEDFNKAKAKLLKSKDYVKTYNRKLYKAEKQALDIEAQKLLGSEVQQEGAFLKYAESRNNNIDDILKVVNDAEKKATAAAKTKAELHFFGAKTSFQSEAAKLGKPIEDLNKEELLQGYRTLESRKMYTPQKDALNAVVQEHYPYKNFKELVEANPERAKNVFKIVNDEEQIIINYQIRTNLYQGRMEFEAIAKERMMLNYPDKADAVLKLKAIEEKGVYMEKGNFFTELNKLDPEQTMVIFKEASIESQNALERLAKEQLSKLDKNFFADESMHIGYYFEKIAKEHPEQINVMFLQKETIKEWLKNNIINTALRNLDGVIVGGQHTFEANAARLEKLAELFPEMSEKLGITNLAEKQFTPLADILEFGSTFRKELQDVGSLQSGLRTRQETFGNVMSKLKTGQLKGAITELKLGWKDFMIAARYKIAYYQAILKSLRALFLRLEDARFLDMLEYVLALKKTHYGYYLSPELEKYIPYIIDTLKFKNAVAKAAHEFSVVFRQNAYLFYSKIKALLPIETIKTIGQTCKNVLSELGDKILGQRFDDFWSYLGEKMADGKTNFDDFIQRVFKVPKGEDLTAANIDEMNKIQRLMHYVAGGEDLAVLKKKDLLGLTIYDDKKWITSVIDSKAIKALELGKQAKEGIQKVVTEAKASISRANDEFWKLGDEFDQFLQREVEDVSTEVAQMIEQSPIKQHYDEIQKVAQEPVSQVDALLVMLQF